MIQYTARDYYREAWRKLRTSGHGLLKDAFVFGAQAQYLLEVWIQTGGNGHDNYRANCAEIAAVRSWLIRENLCLCDDASMHHMAWFYNRTRRGYPIPLPETAHDDTGWHDPRVPLTTVKQS